MELEIEFLLIADAVEVVNQKLYALGGGWNRWSAKSFPTQIRLGLAVSVSVPWERTNERIPVAISILDADGHDVGPGKIAAEVEIGRPTGIAQGTSQRAILGVNAAFPIEKPGRYVIRAVAGDDGEPEEVFFDAVLTT
jgi:hypothetical protein